MTDAQLDQTTVLGSVATNTNSTKRRRSTNSEGEPVSGLGEWRRAGTEPPDWDFDNVFGPPPGEQATWAPEESEDESGCGETFQCASPDTMAGNQRPEQAGSESDPANAFDNKHDVGTATDPQGWQDPRNGSGTTPSQAQDAVSTKEGCITTSKPPTSSFTEIGRRRGGIYGPRTIVPWRQQRKENPNYISEREQKALTEGSIHNVGAAGKRSTRARVEKYTR